MYFIVFHSRTPLVFSILGAVGPAGERVAVVARGARGAAPVQHQRAAAVEQRRSGTRPAPTPFRVSVCAARTLKRRRSLPGHAIAAGGALKSSLGAMPGGKAASHSPPKRGPDPRSRAECRSAGRLPRVCHWDPPKFLGGGGGGQNTSACYRREALHHSEDSHVCATTCL